MFKKKAILIAGAAVVTVSLLVGVTYAWFTDVHTSEFAQITAGNLGIEFSVVPSADEAEEPLYPISTVVNPDTGKEEPSTDGEYYDVATRTITIQNASSREVFVKINGGALLAGIIRGSEINVDESGNVIDGSYPAEIADTSAFKIRYDFGEEDDIWFKDITDGRDAYIYLPDGTSSKVITVEIWIDGELCDNTYQFATLQWGDMTATAVQYRKAAIQKEFPDLTPEDLDEIELKFVNFK